MANGLGDFASLLGQAYSQSARQREDEYDSNRRKAQRQQLLTMFAAPIVQGLGEGVVDFAGDLFLGDNSKDFFSTREGNTLVRRLGSTQDALKDVESQISQMTKAAQGGDIYEGAYQLNREGAIQSLVGQHKGLGAEVEQIVLADIAGQEQELRDVSRVEVDDLIKFRDELRLAPSNEEVLRRYKASKLNRTVPQKLAAGLGNFIFRRDPKDLTDSAVRQILTGGDPKTQQADWYRMFQQDGYEENLSTRLREALDIRGANFDMDSETANFMTELMSIRPEFYASLPEEQNAKTSAITQDLAHRRMARKNPSYGIAYNEAKNVFGDRPSREQVEAIALRNLKGISKEYLPDFVSTYRLGVGQEALKPVQDAFAGKLYKGKIFDDLDTPEQGPVDEATDKFLATLVGSFHRDLRVVKNKIGKGWVSKNKILKKMTKENFVNENKPFKTDFKLARLIVKKYGLKSKVVLSKRSGTSKGDYGVEYDTIELRKEYENLAEFIISVLHEIKHALDAKHLKPKRFLKKYKQASKIAAYQGLDRHDANKWEKRAESWAQREWKRYWKKKLEKNN